MRPCGSAVIEFGAPLLVLFGGPELKSLGVMLLMAMHAYIISHFAHADVYSLNWVSVHVLYYCHVHTPTVDLSSISNVALALLCIDFGYAVFGQMGNTHRTIQSHCYKYWSGNTYLLDLLVSC